VPENIINNLKAPSPIFIRLGEKLLLRDDKQWFSIGGYFVPQTALLPQEDI